MPLPSSTPLLGRIAVAFTATTATALLHFAVAIPVTTAAPFGIVDHSANSASFACLGSIEGGERAWFLQRDRIVTVWWNRTKEQGALNLLGPNITYPLNEKSTGFSSIYNFVVPNTTVLEYVGPYDLSSTLTPSVLLLPSASSNYRIQLVPNISACHAGDSVDNQDRLPSFVAPLLGGLGGLVLLMFAMFLWKRYQRSARTRRKGKAASELDLYHNGEHMEDGVPMQENKHKSVHDWMAKAVRKASFKDANSDHASTHFSNESTKSVNSDGPLLGKPDRDSIENGHVNGTTPLYAANGVSSAALAIPIPKNSAAPAAGPLTSPASLPNGTAASSVPASVAAQSLVRSYKGPPPRFTGGSSTWTAPTEKGVLCRAVFSHKPDEFDEMLLKRGDYVVVDLFFEDGWALVHIIQPLQYKFPLKPTNTQSTSSSSSSGFTARFRPKKHHQNHKDSSSSSSTISSSLPTNFNPPSSKKGKEVDSAYRSTLNLLLPPASTSSTNGTPETDEITLLHASLNQPRDQTKSGVVPWHCLVEIHPDEIRTLQQHLAEVQLMTMQHQQILPNKFAFAYR
ncbi:hypothetical protein DFJ77DRAFT_507772 [Powellomyces hirtus]|nr:hypothetical protein DFJ77DRAFT_507772 [Powellomyces hirtus]